MSSKNKADGKSLREEKRRRFAAKQECAAKRQSRQAEHDAWIARHLHFATSVTAQEVLAIKRPKEESSSAAAATAVVEAEAIGCSWRSNLEQWLRPYFDLQDQHAEKSIMSSSNPQQQPNNGERLFIAEGTETVRLLIQQYSDASLEDEELRIPLKSIFVKPTLLLEEPVCLRKDVEQAILLQQCDNDSMTTTTTTSTPPFRVMVGSEEALSAAAGFTVSRGCLACGAVPTNRTEEWLLHQYLEKSPRNKKKHAAPLRLLALDGISDTANLGSMIRTASAMGVSAILLSSDCCDPWYRRAVRVSMGHVVRIPCIRVADLSHTLQVLAGAPWHVTSYAAVLDNSARLLQDLHRGDVSGNWCCVTGNEANGVSPQVAKSCTHTLRIDMEPNVDSLSVPVATGILLNGLREREHGSRNPE